MLYQQPGNHSYELYKFNLRKLKTICIFEGSPRFTKDSDKCSPRADHSKRSVGYAEKICSSSRPPTEVCGSHQTLKNKLTNTQTQRSEGNPSSHADYRGIYRFDFKGFKITPREITLGRPFYSKWALINK